MLYNSKFFIILYSSQIKSNVGFCREGKTGVPREKTQPTYDAESRNRTRDTLVEGKRSHHCQPCSLCKINSGLAGAFDLIAPWNSELICRYLFVWPGFEFTPKEPYLEDLDEVEALFNGQAEDSMFNLSPEKGKKIHPIPSSICSICCVRDKGW